MIHVFTYGIRPYPIKLSLSLDSLDGKSSERSMRRSIGVSLTITTPYRVDDAFLERILQWGIIGQQNLVELLSGRG
jgi:hypothetical protein